MPCLRVLTDSFRILTHEADIFLFAENVGQTLRPVFYARRAQEGTPIGGQRRMALTQASFGMLPIQGRTHFWRGNPGRRLLRRLALGCWMQPRWGLS